MNLDPRLLKLAGKMAIPLVVAVTLGVLGGLAMIFQARLLSFVINGAFLDGKDIIDLQPVLFVLGLVVLARAALTLGSETAAAGAAIRIKMFLRDKIVQHIFARGPVGVGGERSGELATVVTQAVESLDAYFSQYLPQLALAVLIPLSMLVVVFPVDALSAGVLLVTAPLIPAFMILIGRAAELVTRRQFNALQRMSAYFLDVLQGITTLKALNQSRAQAGRVAETSRSYRETTMEVLRVTFLSSFVLELVGTISTAIVAVQIGLRVLYLGMNFEQAFFILLLAPEFYFPLRQLGLRFHAAASGVAAARRIFEILDASKIEGARVANPVKVPDLIERIDFQGVTFKYAGRIGESEEQAVGVEGVDLTLRRGERVALVGPSGAGKTTISYLLLRFIEPQKGQILVNDVPLQGILPPAWRQRVSWVPQNPYLFAGTIAENICLGRPDASFTKVQQAAREAFLEDWIGRLPARYETRLGEGGIGVSGGQLQRIAIARAIFKDAPVVILDEPTSHLDPELENQVEQAIDRLCDGRLVLVIAHRRKTILNSTRIFVMDQGRVAQTGSVMELSEQPGLFAQMLRKKEGVE